MSNTWVELDLRALRNNIHNLRAALPTTTEAIFVVKANAYGHGIIPVAKCAWEADIRWFAVAHLHKAVELRQALPKAHILVLSTINAKDIPEIIVNRLIPLLGSKEHTQAISHALTDEHIALNCHVNIDTGMGRLGFPWEEAPEFFAVYGFVSCVLLIFIAKVLRLFIPGASGRTRWAARSRGHFNPRSA